MNISFCFFFEVLFLSLNLILGFFVVIEGGVFEYNLNWLVVDVVNIKCLN